MQRSASLPAPLLVLLALTACDGDDSLSTDPHDDGGTRIASDAAAAADAGVDAATDAAADAADTDTADTDADASDAASDGASDAATDAAPDAAADAGPGGGLKCKGGYYTGTFQGDWRPGAFDLGGGLTLVTSTIDASGTVDEPGLALTLVQRPTAAGKPTVYDVESGCVTGSSTASGLEPGPFVATLTGSLDCATGEFSGTVDGKYSLFDAGEVSIWEFTGPLTATFDIDSSALEQGEWDLREKQALPTEDPGAGGEGTWDATWQSEDSPELPAECEALLNGMFDADAGVP